MPSHVPPHPFICPLSAAESPPIDVGVFRALGEKRAFFSIFEIGVPLCRLSDYKGCHGAGPASGEALNERGRTFLVFF